MKNLSFRFKLFAVLAVVAIAIAVGTKSPTKPSTIDTTVGVKVETVNPTTGSVTTEQGSVSTEPTSNTGGVRRVQFTVRPRLGDGGSTNR